MLAKAPVASTRHLLLIVILAGGFYPEMVFLRDKGSLGGIDGLTPRSVHKRDGLLEEITNKREQNVKRWNP